jgi:hypothetical protein
MNVGNMFARLPLPKTLEKRIYVPTASLSSLPERNPWEKSNRFLNVFPRFSLLT